MVCTARSLGDGGWEESLEEGDYLRRVRRCEASPLPQGCSYRTCPASVVLLAPKLSRLSLAPTQSGLALLLRRIRSCEAATRWTDSSSLGPVACMSVVLLAELQISCRGTILLQFVRVDWQRGALKGTSRFGGRDFRGRQHHGPRDRGYTRTSAPVH